MNILITGGLGFIGVNLAKHFAENPANKIIVLDNMSRNGNIHNYYQLSKYSNVQFFIKDIKDYSSLEHIFKQYQFDIVFHLAAQVAVTTSIDQPRYDFEVNCLGTFNLLECCRNYNKEAIFLYTSTNKVYGDFSMDVVETPKRYEINNFNGIKEDQQLDFHSPYGCSKGCGDQYVIDYNRIYGLKTVSLRQSCVYGHNQFGIEDQGWVSWFGIASIFNKPITIYGTGKQVRDVLYIEDLIKLYESIIASIDKCSGMQYNIGGGPSYTLSLLELVDILQDQLNKDIPLSFDSWRDGDQKVYISNIEKITSHTGWTPCTDINTGIRNMLSWIKNNKKLFTDMNLI